MGDTVKHRATVVAEGRRQVRENLPFVLLAHLGTRNRGRGSPVLHLWSDPVWRRNRDGWWRYIDRYPKAGIQLREKNIKPILSLFPFSLLNPKFVFIFLFFYAIFCQKLRWGRSNKREYVHVDHVMMNIKDKVAHTITMNVVNESVSHRCNWTPFTESDSL